MPTTARMALPYPAGTDPANIPLDIQELADQVAAQAAGFLTGTIAARPAASAALARFYYFATDVSTADNRLSVCVDTVGDGTGWAWLSVLAGPNGRLASINGATGDPFFVDAIGPETNAIVPGSTHGHRIESRNAGQLVAVLRAPNDTNDAFSVVRHGSTMAAPNDADQRLLGVMADGRILPGIDGAQDFGAQSLRWRNLYLSGAAEVQSVHANADGAYDGNTGPASMPPGLSTATFSGNATWPTASGFVVTHNRGGTSGRVVQTVYERATNKIWRRSSDAAATPGWLPWQEVKGGGGELLADVVVASGTAEVTISSIPQNFHTLLLGFELSSSAGTGTRFLNLRLNGVTTSNYAYQTFKHQGATLGGMGSGGTTQLALTDSASPTTTYRGYALLPNYNLSDMTGKPVQASLIRNGGDGFVVNGYFGSTAAITSITLRQDAYAFASGRVKLIGL